jgi:peptidoglycan-associated lipoprotein
MTTRALRFALIAAASTLAVACASKPKPQPVAETAPPAQQPQAPVYTAPTQPVQQTPSGPVPGSQQDFVINAGERVYFDLDQHTIRDDARPVLDQQAAWLNRYPNVAVRIEGNADERGTREYNFALGARRANAVRDYLVSRGVAPSRIDTISYGKERPINPGSNEEAWAQNRNARTALTGGTR